MPTEPNRPSDPGPAPNRADRRRMVRNRAAAAGGSAAVLATGALAALVGGAAPAGAGTFTVTEATDDGTGTVTGTLSWAIAQANGAAGEDTIDFAPSLGTVTATGSMQQVQVTEAVHVVGPGADLLTIDLDGQCGFDIDVASGATSISGVTIIDGSKAGSCAFRSAGGAVQFHASGDATFSIADAAFRGNYAYYYGGAIAVYDDAYVDVQVSISQTRFEGNWVGYGGGAFVVNVDQSGDSVSVTDSVFVDNSAEEDGGAIEIEVDQASTAVISRSTFTGNSATQGGAINHERGPLLVENSTISENTARQGGGIRSDEALTLVQVTVTGNTADNEGGGVYSRVGSFGYGVHSTLTLVASTVSANSGGTGDELFFDRFSGTGDFYANPVISGSIVASSSDDAVAGLGDANLEIDHSLIGTASGVTIVDGGGNTLDVTDPGLGALADNGGPTETMAPNADSPAVDAGPTTWAGAWYSSIGGFDQRRSPYVRIFGSAADIGAVEVQPDPDPGPSPDPGPPPVPEPTFTG